MRDIESKDRQDFAAAGLSEVTLPDGARIVDDARYLPDPRAVPRRPGRLTGLFNRILGRSSPLFGLFVLVALLAVGYNLDVDIRIGYWDDPTVALSMLLGVMSTGVTAIIPAAVLMWRPDAWRSARLVLLGAVIWTTAPSLVPVLGRFVMGPQGMGDEAFFLNLIAGDLVWLVSLAGPPLMAIGLERTRASRTNWRPLILLALVAVAVVLVVRNLSDGLSQPYFGGEPGSLQEWTSRIGMVIWSLNPFGILGPGLLSWISLSAIRAGESPRAQWRAMFAGSTLIVAASLYATVVPLVAWWSLLDQIWFYLFRAAGIAGMTMLVLAFMSGVFFTDRDMAESPG